MGPKVSIIKRFHCITIVGLVYIDQVQFGYNCTSNGKCSLCQLWGSNIHKNHLWIAYLQTQSQSEWAMPTLRVGITIKWQYKVQSWWEI